jgi:hypothetical protein
MAGRACRIASFIWLLSCMFPALVQADGGAVQFHRRSGPFMITLFSSPVPLRAGEADLSVLVELAESNQPVLDADVSLEVRKPGAQLSLKATHAQATNKLLYAALAKIPAPGNWSVTVSVKQANLKGSASGPVNVLPGPAAFVSYWPYFAIVPCAIVLFVLNQMLKSRSLRR